MAAALPAVGRVAFALAEGGGLYALDSAAGHWRRVADVGTRHRRIAVDCGFIYGVNEELGVDFQRLKGASPGGWKGLAKGYVVSIAAWDGSVYGVGRAEGGDKVYRLARTAGALSGKPWECASGGRCLAVAAFDARLYVSGLDGWIYHQPLCGLSENSKWQRAFQAGSVQGSFAVLRETLGLGVGADGQALLLDGALGSCRPAPAAGLPGPVVAVGAAGAGDWPEEVHSCPPVLALLDAATEDGGCPPTAGAPGAGPEGSSARPLPTPARASAERGEARPAKGAAGSRAPAPAQQCGLRVGGQAMLQRPVQAAPGSGYLSLEAGDCVKVLYIGSQDDESERGWLFCRPLQGLQAAEPGWLPRRAVEEEEEEEAEAALVEAAPAAARPGPLPGPAVALRAVAGGGGGYLALAAGERVEVAHVGSEATQDAGWLYGRNAAGQDGWFPASALEVAEGVQVLAPHGVAGGDLELRASALEVHVSASDAWGASEQPSMLPC